MAKRVRSGPAYLNARLVKVERSAGGHGRGSDRSLRCKDAEKQMAILGFRPAMLEIIDDRFCNNSRQRIDRGMSCLAGQDLKSFALPVNIIQGQLRDLMCPQAIGHQKKQNRVVPPSPNRPSLHRFQHAADFIPRNRTGHIIKSIYLWSPHGTAEIPSRDPLAVTESQQDSQMTAETKACAGSHLRPVLHNESCQNCRGQLTERRDASSTEVLGKLIQVATVIPNSACRESAFALQILGKPRNL